MKVKKLFFSVILCLVPVVVSFNCYAQESTSLDLVNNAKQYDGKTVNYKGEVIGEVMIRGDYAWLHVNDGTIAIGIWALKASAEEIRYAGDYHKKGDTVEVSGVFHRSCSEHGGDLDIHASIIKKITSGNLNIQPANRRKVYVGVYSLVLVLLFYALKKFFQNKTVA